MMKDNKKEAVKIGLANMFKDLNYHTILDKMTSQRVPLAEHPFGLNVDDKEGRITFLGFPGHTDISIRAMISHIRWSIAGNQTETAKPNKLRVIRCSTSDQKLASHKVYFEINTTFGVFICGGCTNYSGEGIRGKDFLEGVFALLSLIYDTPIEGKTIFFPQSSVYEEKLKSAINAFRTNQD